MIQDATYTVLWIIRLRPACVPTLCKFNNWHIY